MPAEAGSGRQRVTPHDAEEDGESYPAVVLEGTETCRLVAVPDQVQVIDKQPRADKQARVVGPVEAELATSEYQGSKAQYL